VITIVLSLRMSSSEGLEFSFMIYLESTNVFQLTLIFRSGLIKSFSVGVLQKKTNRIIGLRSKKPLRLRDYPFTAGKTISSQNRLQ
ncbi:hypothetical protein EBT16_10525, partial [bacterium]|nr:hypothetical protein [bacterium]